MKVSVNQPAYLPWLGYFDRIDFADIHVVLDHVQFEKNSFINRNKLLSNTGKQWITLPVTKGDNGEITINKIRCFQNKKWIKKHLGTISQNYSKTPYYSDYFPHINEVLLTQTDNSNFFEIVESINKLFLKFLDIKTPIVYSSDLKLNSKKSKLVFDICKYFNAKVYLSGINGKDYLEVGDFFNHNIEVLYQSYNHPTYFQKNSYFTPYLSIIDLLFHEGSDSINILRKGRNFIK
jgi:hypothetical protein